MVVEYVSLLAIGEVEDMICESCQKREAIDEFINHYVGDGEIVWIALCAECLYDEETYESEREKELELD